MLKKKQSYVLLKANFFIYVRIFVFNYLIFKTKLELVIRRDMGVKEEMKICLDMISGSSDFKGAHFLIY